MFNKLVLILIFTFILLGCEERKAVTANMLEGTWDCTINEGRITTYYWGTIKVVPPKVTIITNEKFPLFFYKEQDGLTIISKFYEYFIPNQNKNKSYTKFNASTECESKYQTNRTFSKFEHIFISENEFKQISDTRYEYCDPKRTGSDLHFESTCTIINN